MGGRVEDGETLIACLARELKEELSCEIVLNPPPKYYLETPPTPALDDPDKTVQIIWYKLAIKGNPTASSEIAEVKWVDPVNPGVELSPQIRKYLLPALV